MCKLIIKISDNAGDRNLWVIGIFEIKIDDCNILTTKLRNHTWRIGVKLFHTFFLFFNFTNFPNFKKSTDSKIEFIYCLGLPFGKNKIEIRRACTCNKNNATAIMSVIWGYLLHKISVVSSSLKYDVHRSARCWWKQLPEGGLFFIFIAYSIQFSYKNIIWLLLINF